MRKIIAKDHFVRDCDEILPLAVDHPVTIEAIGEVLGTWDDYLIIRSERESNTGDNPAHVRRHYFLQHNILQNIPFEPRQVA